MSNTLRIGVHGAGGRMGRAVIQAVAADDSVQLVAATDTAGSELLGNDAGELAAVGPLGVVLRDDPAAAFGGCDAVIDFSRPIGTMTLVDSLGGRGIVLVTGTTGLSAAEQTRLDELAEELPVLQAANFSIGVNLCIRLTELAARVMDRHADVEIIEAHHRDKVDAPSGTALRLGRAVAEVTGRSLDSDAIRSRDGNIGPRPERGIGFATVRGGDIVGEHTVLFAAEGERVEISHRASSRQNFARGALAAAHWLQGRAPGHYTMNDVLEL